MVSYVYTNLPVSDIVRLPHPRSRDSQGQETFLAPSSDKQTRNYDTECSNHHPSLYPHTRVSSCVGLISVAWVNEERTPDVTRVPKTPGAELCENAYGERTKK